MAQDNIFSSRQFLRLSAFTSLGLALAVATACSTDDEPAPLGGTGDGDTAGDGDGVAGDGDGVVGDGDGVVGDGDGVVGDGDGVVGDGDGDGDGSFVSRFGQAIGGGAVEADYATIPITIGGESYNVITNPWGGATQTITAGSGKIFEVTSISHPGGGNPWDVASFPSVVKGGSNPGDWTTNSGMPLQVSSINSVRTGLKTNALDITYDGNTTYDVYFTNAQAYNGGGPDRYLMVWFHSRALNPINGEGEGWSCGSNPPTQIEACTTRGSLTVGGKVFHRFVGINGSSTVISYAPEVSFSEWEFELKDFIDDAVAQDVLTPTMYLQSVQAGFELADGGTGLTIYDYYVNVE